MAPVTGGNSMNQKEISSSEYMRHSMLNRSSAAHIKCLSAEEILKELNKLRQKRYEKFNNGKCA
jgi:hypothetical protein